MQLFTLLTSIGLALDIMGVIFLFIYGLPSKVERDLYFEEKEPEAGTKGWKKNRRIIRRAYLGLSLLIIGFFFQLLGVLLN